MRNDDTQETRISTLGYFRKSRLSCRAIVEGKTSVQQNSLPTGIEFNTTPSDFACAAMDSNFQGLCRSGTRRVANAARGSGHIMDVA